MKNTIKIVISLSLISILIGGSIKSGVTIKAASAWDEPADVKLVTKEVLNSPIDPRCDGTYKFTDTVAGVTKTYTSKETYNPKDRMWQGLPSVAKIGKRLWCCWYTGGSGEPSQLNYVVLAYSDDEGKNWVDPFIVVDNPDLNHDGVSLVVPQLFVDGEDLCLHYMQSKTWIVRFHNAGDEDITKLTWDEPKILTTSKLQKPVAIVKDADGSDMWIAATEVEVGDSHVESTRIYVSKDKGKTWQMRASLPSAAATNRRWPETSVAQAGDGTLILASRLEGGAGGGIERSISKDYGYTWSSYEINLEEPFIGPGSKVHLMGLASGSLVMINHATTTSRALLYAYLSIDNGETWPYKVALDLRNDLSYPCAFESVDDHIYVVWDKGRYKEKEIRISCITIEDIISGEILGETSFSKRTVSKVNPSYTEIVEIVDSFDRNQIYTVGTNSAVIRDKLPTTIKVKDSKGTEYTLNGTWKSSGYKANVAGVYFITFNTDLPASLSDTYDMLRVRVELVEKGDEPGNVTTAPTVTTEAPKTDVPQNPTTPPTTNANDKPLVGGCNNSITIASIATISALIPLLGVVLIKRKENE